MVPLDLRSLYEAYIACLNARDWDRLGTFVAAEVTHNGRPLGLSGYRAMLERDVSEIPDLRFEIRGLVCEPPWIACRLQFDCSPAGRFLGLDIGGRRVQFAEHVFYRVEDGRIVEVLSVLDKSAIEAQL